MCHIVWYGKELTECLWYCYMKQSMFATPRRIFGDDFHPRKTLCYCYCCFYCRFATPERTLADHFQWTLVSSDWWYNLGAKNGMQCLSDKAAVWWEWEFRFSPGSCLPHYPVKGILPQKIFYRPNLIFSIVTGCGKARFGRKGKKNT